MRIIFIRHAEPDYEHNTLTEKGFREARILSDRIPGWKVDRFYVSPLARAQLTLEPSLAKMRRTAQVLPWMREFTYLITDPTTGQENKVPWDFMPRYWTKRPAFYDKDNWYKDDIFGTSEGYEEAVMNLRQGLDELLAEYGYKRDGAMYRTDIEKTNGDDDKTIVICAHLGANLEAIGYLLGISPVVLQQTIYLAPTSISILNSEQRLPGEAMFRAQCIGDVAHLLKAGEPVSEYGAFCRVMRQY